MASNTTTASYMADCNVYPEPLPSRLFTTNPNEASSGCPQLRSSHSIKLRHQVYRATTISSPSHHTYWLSYGFGLAYIASTPNLLQSHGYLDR